MIKLKDLITEAKEPLWTEDNVKDVIKQIQKGLKNAVPYTDGIGTGALGKDTIIGKISLDPKKTWPNGYIENSRWAMVHIEPSGIMDSVSIGGYDSYEERKKVPKLRKSRNKNIHQIIQRLGKYLTMVRIKYPKGHLKK